MLTNIKKLKFEKNAIGLDDLLDDSSWYSKGKHYANVPSQRF